MQYADFGDFGRLYKMPSVSLNPDPLILHVSLRLGKLEYPDCDDSVHCTMVSAWSHSTGQLFRESCDLTRL